MLIQKTAIAAAMAVAFMVPTMTTAQAHQGNNNNHRHNDNAGGVYGSRVDVRNNRRRARIDDRVDRRQVRTERGRRNNYARYSDGNVYTPGIDRRIERQRTRIRRGRRIGDLSRWEARRLKFRLSDIRFATWRAKRDGDVTRYERKDLHQMLNRNSKRIRRLRNNDNGGFGFRRRVRLSLGY